MTDSPRLTPPSQLVVDTLEVQRRTGNRRPFEVDTQLPDLVAGEFSVVDGLLRADLIVEAVTEGVAASGTVSGQWTGPCRRCLEPIVDSFETEMREIFQRNPTDDDIWPIEEERINLAPVIREAALLAFPLVPLCSDDCVGPDPDRYTTTVEVDVDLTDEAPPPDPRWAALDGLNFDDE